MNLQLPALFEKARNNEQRTRGLPLSVPLVQEVEGEFLYRLFSDLNFRQFEIARKSTVGLYSDGERLQVPLAGVVYIAGPMRGIPHHNFPAFDEAAARYRDKGFFVFNPADLDRAEGINEDVSVVTNPMLRAMLRRDTDAISRSSHIALLPGWENSSGVRPEGVLSDALSLEFQDASTYAVLNSLAVCAVIGARMIGRFTAAEKLKLNEAEALSNSLQPVLDNAAA